LLSGAIARKTEYRVCAAWAACCSTLLAAAVAIAVAVASNDATPPVWQHYHYQVRLLFADIQVCK